MYGRWGTSTTLSGFLNGGAATQFVRRPSPWLERGAYVAPHPLHSHISRSTSRPMSAWPLIVRRWRHLWADNVAQAAAQWCCCAAGASLVPHPMASLQTRHNARAPLSGEALLPATKAAQLPSTTKVARPHSNFPTRREVPTAGREGRAVQLKHPLPGRAAATGHEGRVSPHAPPHY